MEPINYLQAMGGLQGISNPGQSFQEGMLVGEEMQAKRRAEQAAAQRASAKQRDVQLALQDPTPDNVSALLMMYPEDRESIKAAWDLRDEAKRQSDQRILGMVYPMLQNGNQHGALKLIDSVIAANREAGQDDPVYEQFKQIIEADPKSAAFSAGTLLSATAGDKFAEAFQNIGTDRRAEQLQPSAVKKSAADATKAQTEAEFAPQVIQSDLASEAAERQFKRESIQVQIDKNKLDWERLNLDRDALETTTALKVEELTQQGQKIEGPSLAEMTNSVASAEQNVALAERTKSLADRIETAPLRGAGVRSWIGETAAGMFGNQDAVSALRNEYQRLIHSQAIKNLPPGSASDKDVVMALKGFPPDTAGKDHLVSFLRGLEKLQRAAAQSDQSKADWISQNGNIGTARRDINVGGVMVPRGTTFAEFRANQRKYRSGPPPQRSYMRFGQ